MRHQTSVLLASTVATQTKLTAFVNGFWFITASFAVMIPLVLLLRSRRPVRAVRAAPVAAD